MAMPSDSEIRALSPAQRIRLIERLWETFVEAPETLPLSQEQREELRRRVAAHDANPDEARPWSEVRAEIERE